MHVGVDATNLLEGSRRGMNRYVRNVLRGLARIGPDLRFTFFVRPKDSVDAQKEMEALGLPRSRAEIESILRLRSASFDLYWQPWSFAKYLPRRGPLVVTIHDVTPFLFPDQLPKNWFRRYKLLRRFRRGASRADLVLTDSEFSRHEIPRCLRVPTTRIRVARLGADDFTPGDRTAAAEEVRRLGVDGPYLLYVGGHEERKNLVRLVHAFALLRSRHGLDYRLVLAGPAPAIPAKLAALLNDEGVRDAARYFGNVTDPTLQALYRAARVLVFPSVYEGFGLPLLEAMASGTPVVAASASCLPEVAGDAALFFDPLDVEELVERLRMALTDESLRRQLIAKGIVRAAQFPWEATARTILEAFEALVVGRPRHGALTAAPVLDVERAAVDRGVPQADVAFRLEDNE